MKTLYSVKHWRLDWYQLEKNGKALPGAIARSQSHLQDIAKHLNESSHVIRRDYYGLVVKNHEEEVIRVDSATMAAIKRHGCLVYPSMFYSPAYLAKVIKRSYVNMTPERENDIRLIESLN